MKKTFAMMLCLLVPMSVVAADSGGYKVMYDGGSIPDIKAGTGLRLYIESKQVSLVGNKTVVITIPVSSVTEISYGEDVHRRVGTAIGLAVVSLGIGALMALANRRNISSG